MLILMLSLDLFRQQAELVHILKGIFCYYFLIRKYIYIKVSAIKINDLHT